MDYTDFIRAAVILRRIRLERDVALKRIDGTLLPQWIGCKLFLGKVAI